MSIRISYDDHQYTYGNYVVVVKCSLMQQANLFWCPVRETEIEIGWRQRGTFQIEIMNKKIFTALKSNR